MPNIDNNHLIVVYILTSAFISLLSIKLPEKLWLIFHLPGTFTHEMLHFLTGLLFFAKPTSFSILPKKTETGNWQLGEVWFDNLKWYNVIFVSLAPLAILPISAAILVNMPNDPDRYIALAILSILSTSALPSRVDLMAIYNNKTAMILISLSISYAIIKHTN